MHGDLQLSEALTSGLLLGQRTIYAVTWQTEELTCRWGHASLIVFGWVTSIMLALRLQAHDACMSFGCFACGCLDKTYSLAHHLQLTCTIDCA